MDTVVAEWLRRLDSQTLPCIQNVTDVGPYVSIQTGTYALGLGLGSV